jgi:hypothetical protein
MLRYSSSEKPVEYRGGGNAVESEKHSAIEGPVTGLLARRNLLRAAQGGT